MSYNVKSHCASYAKLAHFFKRVSYASSYFNKKYIEILKWGFNSKEDTNYTYGITNENMLYLAHTISIVTGKPIHEVRGYIDELNNDNELRKYVISKTKHSQFNAASDERCEFGRRIGWYAFIRCMKPRYVVETGVDKGLGSVLICRALMKNNEDDPDVNGYYYGTDINLTAGWLLDDEYKNYGKILYGDSIKSLKNLDIEIDLFINDSDHDPRYEYKEYQVVKDKLSKRAVILGDNSHVSDKLALFSIRNNRKFLFFQEMPKNHWFPGAGIGISYTIDM